MANWNLIKESISEANQIVSLAKQRLKVGKATIVLVCGLGGTGKSSVCARSGQIITKEIHGDESSFTEENIVDSLVDLLKVIRKVKKPGEVIVVEEMSVLFPSRRSMAADNVAIGRILDTIRKKQIILLCNAPVYNSVDSHIRVLANMLIETLSINRTEKVVTSKVLYLQPNIRSGKVYTHTPQSIEGGEAPLMWTGMPQGDIWEKYEVKKDKFLDELYEKLEEDAKKREKKNKKDIKPRGLKRLSQREYQIYDLYFNEEHSQTAIANRLNLSKQRVSQIVGHIRQKMELSEGNPIVKAEINIPTASN